MAGNTSPTVAPDPPMVQSALAVIAGEGQTYELRALDVPSRYRPQTVSGYYDDLDRLTADAVELSERGARGVYVTLNPTLPDLLARRANRCDVAEKNATTSDHHIAERRWLLVDLDATRPSGISATDTEHAAALELARRVRDELAAEGWPMPVEADSGNGAHLLYRVDLPADDDGLLKRCLDALARRFNTPAVSVDVTVANAARITKLYGTVVRKGDDLPTRPHRRATLLAVPDALLPVERGLLDALGGHVEPTTTAPTPTHTTAQPRGDHYDVQAFLRKAGLTVKREVSKSLTKLGPGTLYELDVCPWNAEHNAGEAWVFQADDGKLASGCPHNSCAGKNWHDLRAMHDPKPAVKTNTRSTSHRASTPTATFPAPLAAAAHHGVVGEAVRLLAPQSEADPAVLLVRLLSAAGGIVGRTPHIDIDGIDHPARLWPVVVGGTSRGRKGQSWGSVRRLLKLADPDFTTNHIASGLTTGQGLVHAVRDPVRGIPTKKPSRAQQEEMDANLDQGGDGLCVLDPGVSDKRLLVREPELAKVLAAASREGNNLSATLRDAWDGNPMREMTRTNPYGSTDHHVVVQADVTPAELRVMLTATEKANGFANRFLFVASRRSKSLPFGGDLDAGELARMADRLAAALDDARQIGAMTWTPDARPVWAELYERMNAGHDEDDGPLSMLLARGPTHVLRLSIAYAVLDGTDAIEPVHIAAAGAVWRYVADSTAWAFGEAVVEVDPLDALAAWAAGKNPTAAELARSGPQRYRGDVGRAEAELQALADRGGGTYEYDAGPGKPAKRFTPSPGGYGYETPTRDPASRRNVSVSTPAAINRSTNGTAATHREVEL